MEPLLLLLLTMMMVMMMMMMIDHQVDSALAEYEEVCSEAAGAGVDLVSKVMMVMVIVMMMVMGIVMMMVMGIAMIMTSSSDELRHGRNTLHHDDDLFL